MRSMVEFLNCIEFNGIKFAEITDRAIPGIRKGCFFISLEGTIYNSTTKRFSRGTVNNKGYIKIELILENGIRYNTTMHTTMMLVFCYIPGCEVLEVNHIDGNKLNNNLWNLEWLTPEENKIHAKVNNLILKGEDSSQSKLTESQVHEICKELSENRYRNQFVNLSKKYNVEPIVILEIAYGLSWIHISNQYNLNYNDKLNRRFSYEEVEEMCKLFIKLKYNNDEKSIIDAVIYNLNLPNDHNTRTKIKRIYHKNKGNFYDITSKYNW